MRRLAALGVVCLLILASSGCVLDDGSDRQAPRAGATFDYASGSSLLPGTMYWQGIWNVSMDRFQGTFPQDFTPQTRVVALATQGPLNDPNARLVLTDAAGTERLNTPLTEETLPVETTARDHASGERWLLRLETSQPVTGTLTVQVGDPDTVGVHPQEPIQYQETLIQEDQTETWPWPSDGHAQLLVDAQSLAGTATVQLESQNDTLLEAIDLASPDTTNQSAVLHGPPGEWTLTFTPETYTGDVSITLREW